MTESESSKRLCAKKGEEKERAGRRVRKRKDSFLKNILLNLIHGKSFWYDLMKGLDNTLAGRERERESANIFLAIARKIRPGVVVGTVAFCARPPRSESFIPTA